MNNKIFVGLVVLLVGVGVGWYVLKGGYTPKEGSMTTTKEKGKAMPVPETSGVVEKVVETTGGAGQSMEKGGVRLSDIAGSVVTYTNTGFSPTTVTVKKGTTVTFVNASTGGMWVASAVHPTHQLLPGFDQLKSVGKGGSYDYTFVKVGTWKYHNHVNVSDFGSVVVTE